MPKINPELESFARIKVIGVGGSGSNAVNHMIESKVKGVEFIAMNTDAQHLHRSLADKKIHIGKNLTRGLGTGMNPDIGKQAAEESMEDIQNMIKGADMIFVTAGMGGGTGSGAAPVIAKIAKEQGALTVAIVTKPFFFEGKQRESIAEQGISELRNEVDAVIAIPNDRLMNIITKDTTCSSAFAMCDEILRQAVEGLSNTITMPGIINVDFADVRAVMQNAGSALMGIGSASGDNRAIEAAKMAINSPLLDISIDGARGVLFTIAGGSDMTMFEIQDSAKLITESIDSEAKVIFGAIYDDKLKKNEIKITVIATGFPELAKKKNDGPFNIFEKNTNKKTETNTVDITPAPELTTTKEKETNTDYDRPLFSRAPSTNTETTTKPTKETTDDVEDEDWSSIPAFLRRPKK